MRLYSFSIRTAKEIIRDPLNIAFGIGFPLVILLLLTTIQANIPVSLFEIQNITPGITVFGLSFMTLFSATLVAKDRESALLQRLYTTPLTATDFIFGYMLPILPISLLQTLICYLTALIFGLPMSVNLVYAILFNIPVSLFFIALGLLCGSIFKVKQVGGICGALLTNLSAWLSGIWFDIDLLGSFLRKIAEVLPFYHAVELAKAVVKAETGSILPHLYWILGYTVITVILAIFCFIHQMKKQ